MRQSNIVILDTGSLSPSCREKIISDILNSSDTVAIEYADADTALDLDRPLTEQQFQEAKQQVLDRLEQLPIDTDVAKTVAEVSVESLVDSTDTSAPAETHRPHPRDSVGEAESGGFASPTPTQIDFYLLVLQGVLVLIEGIRFAQENRNLFTTIQEHLSAFSFTREETPDGGESYQLSMEDREMIFATVESDFEDQGTDQ